VVGGLQGHTRLDEQFVANVKRGEPPGYVAGQLGKNHLGDERQMLPANARRVLRQPSLKIPCLGWRGHHHAGVWASAGVTRGVAGG